MSFQFGGRISKIFFSNGLEGACDRVLDTLRDLVISGSFAPDFLVLGTVNLSLFNA